MLSNISFLIILNVLRLQKSKDLLHEASRYFQGFNETSRKYVLETKNMKILQGQIQIHPEI